MRGVVTGGAGFLGSHVADVLTEQGHDVMVFDARPSDRHQTVIGDLRDHDVLLTAFRGADFVCHLAAIGDVYLAASDPELAATANVVGTASVCAAMVATHVPVLAYASTWEVYGTVRYEPIDEEHPCNPDHPYSITKLAGERMALASAHLTGAFRATALRLGTAYGARMRPNSVFSVFARNAASRRPILIHGTGTQFRQFTHARDIAMAFELAVRSEPRSSVYNIVSDERVTINQLAEKIAAHYPTLIQHAEARQAEVPAAIVSNARAREELGWRATTRFDDGLSDLLALSSAVQA